MGCNYLMQILDFVAKGEKMKKLHQVRMHEGERYEVFFMMELGH